MKRTIFALAITLAAFQNAAGQTVDESKTNIRFAGIDMITTLRVNIDAASASEIRLELLRANGSVIVSGTADTYLNAGENDVEIKMTFGTQRDVNDLVWKRLRYVIRTKGKSTSGLISLSNVFPDFYVINAVSPEYIFAGSTVLVRVTTAHPISGAPIPNVELNANLRISVEGSDSEDINLTSETMTDATGFAQLIFQVPDGLRLEDVYYDRNTLEIEGSRSGLKSILKEEIGSLNKRPVILINTDKPLYQPGHTIFIRALALETANNGDTKRPVANSEIEFTIDDEDDTTLYRETVETSKFGIAGIKWEIPENAKLGRYSIVAELVDEAESTSSSFKVSRYELPNFFVKTESDKEYYLPADKKARVKVDALYLFGKPVAGGKVKVVRESNREWNYREQRWDIDEEEVYEGKTDKNGVYKAVLDLNDAHKELAEQEYSEFQDLTYTAYYTDSTTNITEERQFDIRISKQDIQVYFSYLPDGDQSTKLPLRFYLTTSLANGIPVSADVELKGAYDDEERKTLSRIKTNKFGAAAIEIQLPKCDSDPCSDYFDLEAVARDLKKSGSKLRDDISIEDDEVQVQVKTSKTIHKKGEPIEVEIRSTEPDRLVFVDLTKDFSILGSDEVRLRNGHAKLTIPYDPKFEGPLQVTASFQDDRDSIADSASLIYPVPRALKIDAKPDNEIYRPATNASVNYSVSNGGSPAGETALGFFVLDRAVEERARTDSGFGGSIDPFWQFRSTLGENSSFGGVTRRQIDELDPDQEISEEMQLTAEILLRGGGYPAGFSGSLNSNPKDEFNVIVSSQMSLIKWALDFSYTRGEHPRDTESLEKILRLNGIDLSEVKDPWGNPYYAKFAVSKDEDHVYFYTNGPNKIPNDDDDFDVLGIRFKYFTETAKRLNSAVWDYQKQTGKYVRDQKAVSAAIENAKLPSEDLTDRWGNPYRFEFDAEGRNLLIHVKSGGLESPETYDDFVLHTISTNYSAPFEEQIRSILYPHAEKNKSFPKDEKEFRRILKSGGLDFDSLRDPWGRKLFITVGLATRFADNVRIETHSLPGEASGEQIVITPVTQVTVTFSIRSHGKTVDKEINQWNTPVLTTFTGVISEQAKGDKDPKSVIPRSILTNGRSAIFGVVTDQTGAVIPGANVTAENTLNGAFKTVTSNSEGAYVIGDLPAGNYRLKIELSGFKLHIVNGISLPASRLIEINSVLEPGGVSMTVEVSADVETMIDTNSASISTNITQSMIEALPQGNNFSSLLRIAPGVISQPLSGGFQVYGASGAENTFVIEGRKVTDFRSGAMSAVTRSGTGQIETPRIRNYFPETLLWAPEVITDENGNTTVKFTLADNITTWKIYTVASNLEGKIGLAENEIKTFQPFFVDLLPPRILTEGDEISLPVQVRNYTEQKQNVEVALRNEDWFAILDPSARSNQRIKTARPESVELNIASNTAGRSVSSAVTRSASSSSVPTGTESGLASSSIVNIAVDSNSTGNAVFNYRTLGTVNDGIMNVTAKSGEESDAIEKPVTVKPDGEEIVKTESRIFTESTGFQIEFPETSIPNSENVELKIYPNLFSHAAESVEGQLKRPYGCGEQTISSTYPNIMLMQFTGEEDKLHKAAKTFLQKGYERLLGYQVSNGGFTYWGGKDEPDEALTAYALRFLDDAGEFIDVDEDVIGTAQKWLIGRQQTNGSWNKVYKWETSENTRRTWQISTYIARSLAKTSSPDDSNEFKVALDSALRYLEKESTKIDEPYSLANLGLAYADYGRSEQAAVVAKRLAALSKTERDGLYWNLETNTPFFGWGTAGRIETTALALQLLVKNSSNGEYDDEISKASIFLLRNKDRHGVWHSTQATINVLDAILSTIKPANKSDSAERKAFLYVDGEGVKEITLPASGKPAFPIVENISKYVNSRNHRIEIRSDSGETMQAQVVARHYVGWENSTSVGPNTNESRQLALEYTCDKYEAKPTQEITCSVKAERIGYRGYGMLLAEIGIPPGADVDRASLEKAKNEDSSFSRYDVLPDRIVIYMWSKAGGSEFSFKFKPRYGINAQTPASSVYDYYNEEAKAVVKPMRFVVR